MLDKLETVLSHLLEYHSALLDLGKEKITVITNKDIDRFEKITLEEQALVRKIEQEEKQRQKPLPRPQTVLTRKMAKPAESALPVSSLTAAIIRIFFMLSPLKQKVWALTT